uniref:Candidate secreted effector n=1 Tax=Meloidogyne incognita TaxID=6306 RepID=A0A914NDE4_MELIC
MAGGTTSSSNLIGVRFQIRRIADLSCSFASSMFPSVRSSLLGTHFKLKNGILK